MDEETVDLCGVEDDGTYEEDGPSNLGGPARSSGRIRDTETRERISGGSA